ncbi:hypothetical protein ABI59_13235 [Acidobacteria bacterium Mor1]|nr:hypothetical protein ABI59_13235 [Acidobacteria bacterium Mor1]
MSEGARPGEHCPDADLIWQAAHGEAKPAELDAVVDHLAGCPSCAEAWRLAMPEERGTVVSVPAGRFGGSSGWIVFAGGLAAAALALAVFVAPMESSTRPDLAPTLRNADTQPIVSLLDESVPLSREDCVLRWQWEGGPESVTYDIEVTETDLDPIDSAHGLEQPQYRVPPEALEGLEPGDKLVWRVEASLPDGRRSASSAFIVHLE